MKEEIKEIEKSIKSILKKDREKIIKEINEIKKIKNRDIRENRIIKLLYKIEKSKKIKEERIKRFPKINYPLNLPICGKREEIIELIKNNQVIIVAGETGSGKTTQLPKMCLEAGRGIEGKIGVTQPRRVAATSIADYLAKELGNDKVSYKIRFYTNDTPKVYIKFMTDGILLSEIQNDKLLYEYDTLIIDEAHERSLNIDFILGYIKKILPKRRDLKVIVSSATIDTESFSKFFNNAPIIEVSGRLYDVHVLYNPIDKNLEELGELTLIDVAVDTTKKIIQEDPDEKGDILIFMPGESDIKETINKIKGAEWCKCIVLPLFSKLPKDAQNLIFKNTNKRKIIVATNIAETSITIPNIKYVIDTGLAKISRYSPKAKIKRLPIEPISKSSAEQRKGRCGRVKDGICIRLYSQKDFEKREDYTPPEIKRTNLAEVILKMSAFEMGDIYTFPFINPPSRTSIRDGINTLKELGAFDEQDRLTSLGREMANLPVDPRIGRILLEAIKRNCLKEILIIASGLSIQDPRESSPEDNEKVKRAHQRFINSKSDFISYLNMWYFYQTLKKQTKSFSQLIKTLKRNYISYTRMKEWEELHSELSNILKENKKFIINKKPGTYDDIHISILSGFLSNIAHRKEKNIFYVRQNKEAIIHPSSSQYNRYPEWIVGFELIETTKLFIRTVGVISPDWIEPLAKHIIKYEYTEPYWDKKLGQVIAKEKGILWGIIVTNRRIHYGKINREISREIFIKEGLVLNNIEYKFPFLEYNKKLIENIRNLENKIRKRNILVEEERIEEFYKKRLPDVVNVKELEEYLKNNSDKNLRLTKEDIIKEKSINISREMYPDFIYFGNIKLEMYYNFCPDKEEDGVTIKVPTSLLSHLPLEPFEWIIPGWIKEKIENLLRNFPLKIRKKLNPISHKAEELSQNIKFPMNISLYDYLEAKLKEKYNVEVKRKDWKEDNIPLYLFYRFEIYDPKAERTLAYSRNLEKLQQGNFSRYEDENWLKVKKEIELKNVRTWCFKNIPTKIEIVPTLTNSIPYLGYPGLILKKDKIDLTLFKSLKEAEDNIKIAVKWLLKYTLKNEFERLERGFIFEKSLSENYKRLNWANNLKEESIKCIKKYLTENDKHTLIRKEEEFKKKCEKIKQEIVELLMSWENLLKEILEEYYKIERLLNSENFKRSNLLKKTQKSIKEHLNLLFPSQFLLKIPLEKIKNYPRYLKGIVIRIKRAIISPIKDNKKYQEILPHIENLKLGVQILGYKDKDIQEYRWMLEELKISIFAQGELKTLYPISIKKIKNKWHDIEKKIIIA